MRKNNFTLFSNDLGGQATITEEFDGFGCTGKNKSPHLKWSDVSPKSRRTRNRGSLRRHRNLVGTSPARRSSHH
jgi:hypothetical protein